jgi:hypothetical protein
MTIANFPLRDWPVARQRYGVLLLPLAVALMLAAVGAFGSYISMGLPLRLLHFATVGLLVGALATALSVAAQRYLFAGAQPFWSVLAIAAVTAPPGGWIVWELLSLWAPKALPHVSYVELTGQVLVINLLIGPVIWWLRRPSTGPVARVPALAVPSAPAEPDPLRSKLPFALRNAAILSLSAEDHYVRVRTDRGQALVLMNLSDAVVALGPDAGVRIHRSHWVARDIARGATRQAGRLVVRLDDDTALPVSRAGQKLLRD